MTEHTHLLAVNDRIWFSAPLSNGGTVRWTARVVRVEGETALVRHPNRARSFPFSPVAAPGLYRYRTDTLIANRAIESV